MNQTTQKPIQTLQELAQNLRTDCYYSVLSCHSGDIYVIVKSKTPQPHRLIYIIRPQHEFIFEMFEDKDYIVCEDKGFEIFSTPKCFNLPNVVRFATLGKIVPGDWAAFKKKGQVVADDIIDCNPKNGRLPTNLPKISEHLKARLDKIAPLDKIIILAPEAQSMQSLPIIIFFDECRKLRQQGYFIIVNLAKNKKYRQFFIDGVYDLDLSLKDAVAVALSCAGVISMRSGFCDIIAPHCANLKIYFPDDKKAKLWSLSSANPQHPAIEININDILAYKKIKQEFTNFLPIKLYKRYIAKGFLRRVRTPFTLYFKIYLGYKKDEMKKSSPNCEVATNQAAQSHSEPAQEFKNSSNQNLPNQTLNDKEMREFMKDFVQNELSQIYEFRLGLLLQKACERFWSGGFLAFPFAYLALRKKKRHLQRIGEII